ncbi:hypothetical protein KZO74_04435 [Prevotella salivae]|uniref:hypothetical protein n=1 Tax=Segatella salivae TaxID=228604 RepID=UPI001C5D5896|nr:hypothetical protein [Segatella salivae]MBW4764259.1 hypothetical protein [Segatella salivae]
MEKQILLIVDLFCSYRVANWSFTLSFLCPFMVQSKDFHTRLSNALIRKGMWARNADNGKLQLLDIVWRWLRGKNYHAMDGKLQHEDKQKGY